MFYFKNKKIPQNKSKFISIHIYSFLIFFLFIKIISSKSSSYIKTSNQICSITTYDNTSVTEECLDGPKKRTRNIQYTTFNNYMSDHSFKHNGLPFYSSLYVDTDYHDLGDFMNGGMVIYILFLITIILFAVWIPLLCCWRYKVCIFDECIIRNKGCFILWNFICYFLLAAVLSFIIVCIIFAE